VNARAAYHHGDLRAALIAAAVRHIGARGTENLSLRALAREIGVSPTASYRHFPSRAALLAALATEGFETLAARMNAARSAPDPYARLLDIGVAYVECARADPVRYQLMFGAVLDDFAAFAELHAAADAAYAVLDRIVSEGIAAGVLAPAPVPEVCAAAWAAVHGIAGLVIDQGRNVGPNETVGAAAAIAALATDPRRTLARLLAGLGAGLTSDPS
jgi:AcrR family transcriptional regulator